MSKPIVMERGVKYRDADKMTLSDEQRQYFTGVLPGQGLMKIGSAYVPFDGRPAQRLLLRFVSENSLKLNITFLHRKLTQRVSDQK